MTATHNFTAASNVFKLALYTSSASLGAGTTAYTSSNEASGTGYTAKGAFFNKCYSYYIWNNCINRL